MEKRSYSYRSVLETIVNYFVDKKELTQEVVNDFLENNKRCSKCKLFLPKNFFSNGHHYCGNCKKQYFIERKNRKFICICGEETNKASYYRHIKTKRHIRDSSNQY